MKRFLSLLVALTCVLSILGGSALAEGRIAPEGETQELSIWIAFDAGKAVTMSSYNELKIWPLIEEETGIKVNFIHPTQGNETEQLNLMLASGELPDIIYHYWSTSYPGGPLKAIDDGSIIRLNELIEEHAPNYKKMLETYPQNAVQSMTDDGTLYGFANFSLDDRDPTTEGFIPAFQTFGWLIRRDWLNAVGIDKLPETTVEWEAALTAIRDGDPNGNGEKDEIPLVTNGVEELKNWLTAWGIKWDFFIADPEAQKVGYGFYTEEYRQALEMLNRWYVEGLIDPDFAAADGKQKDSKITSNVAGSWVGSTSGGFGRYITMMKPGNPDLDATGTVPPHIEGGESFKFDTWSKYAMGGQAAITTSCKDPVAAAKFLDYFYAPKGHMYMNYGIEGESYEIVDGIAQFTDLVTANPDGLSVDQVLVQYALSATEFSMLMEPQLWLNRMSLPEQREMLPRWATGSRDRIMPPLTPSSDEAAEMSAILGEVRTYVDEMFTKFVMGVEPLDKFDTYMENLRSLNIERVLELEQIQLDRFNNRNLD